MVLKTDLPIEVVSDGDQEELTVTILSGEAISSPQYVGGATFLGLRMPAEWDVAPITFLESATEDGIFRQLTDGDGDDVTITTTAAIKTHKLDANTFYAIQWLKVVSNINQTADRVIELLMAKV